MKTLKLIMICCFMSLALVSCKKKEQPQRSMVFTIDVTDVTAINARLAIDGKGDAPSLVRYMAPVPESEMLSEIDMADAKAVKAYLSRNGEAITLPYSDLLQNLAPEMTYVVGVVAFDADMDAYSYKTATFTMKDLASMFEETVGDPSNAGNLTENVLK